MADMGDKLDSLMVRSQHANNYAMLRDEPQAVAIGECLFCGELVETGRRGCDAACRDDWQREND